MADIDLIMTAVKAAVDSSTKQAAAGILFRPATVTSIDPLGINATVALDGDEEGTPVGCQVIYPTGIFPGDRVLIVFVQPHGAFLLGRRGGDFDPWHQINAAGDSDFDRFNTGWASATGTNWLETDDPAFVSYRRHGRIIELRGFAQRFSGSSTTMFFLPENYQPENDLLLSGNNALGGHCSVQVRRDGAVLAPDGSAQVFLDGIMYSTNKYGDIPE